MHGDRKKQEKRQQENNKTDAVQNSGSIDILGFKPKRIPKLIWRECTPWAFLSGHIKKILEVDPLRCPTCTGEMKIIDLICKKKVIKKILIHLKVNEDKKRQRAPPTTAPRHTVPNERIPYDDGWPEYDEPVFEF